MFEAAGPAGRRPTSPRDIVARDAKIRKCREVDGVRRHHASVVDGPTEERRRFERLPRLPRLCRQCSKDPPLGVLKDPPVTISIGPRIIRDRTGSFRRGRGLLLCSSRRHGVTWGLRAPGNHSSTSPDRPSRLLDRLLVARMPPTQPHRQVIPRVACKHQETGDSADQHLDQHAARTWIKVSQNRRIHQFFLAHSNRAPCHRNQYVTSPRKPQERAAPQNTGYRRGSCSHPVVKQSRGAIKHRRNSAVSSHRKRPAPSTCALPGPQPPVELVRPTTCPRDRPSTESP